MDCRGTLVACLALLAGASGCTHTLPWGRKADKNTGVGASGWQTNSKNHLAAKKDEAREAARSAKDRTEDDGPKRQPKATTCVAFGEFRLGEAAAPSRSAAEKKRFIAEARCAFEQALDIDPKCLEAHHGLARAFAAEADYQAAARAYQAALQVHPDAVLLWVELGVVHCRLKAWQPAAEAFHHAVQADPDNRQTVHMLGFCLARAGAYEQALEWLRTVDGEAKARYNVARMMYQTRQDVLAREQLRVALEVDPTLKDARDLLARIDAGAAPNPAGDIVPVEHQTQ